MERKRPLGVTIIGWYFIIQGWIALGYHGEFGNFAIVFVALFIGIGIGLINYLGASPRGM